MLLALQRKQKQQLQQHQQVLLRPPPTPPPLHLQPTSLSSVLISLLLLVVQRRPSYNQLQQRQQQQQRWLQQHLGKENLFLKQNFQACLKVVAFYYRQRLRFHLRHCSDTATTTAIALHLTIRTLYYSYRCKVNSLAVAAVVADASATTTTIK